MVTISKRWGGIRPRLNSGEGRGLFADLPGTSCSGLLDLLLLWQERAAQRTVLAGLDERDLRDIGLSRADVEGEVSKPFWRC